MIHPSAVIHPDAQIADDVSVHPFVVVGADVVVAEGTVLLPGTVLEDGARIGPNCRIGPYATIGGVPMDTAFQGERSFAILDEGVTVREFASIHRATGEGTCTRVGTGTLVMSYVHVSHNVTVGQHCTLTSTTQLAGHCSIGDYAFLGAGAMLHQYCRVGAYAMFGATSGAGQDILPFTLARGAPAKHASLNRVGLKRRGIEGERYHVIEQAFRAFRKRDKARLAELAELSEDVRMMLEFADTSTRGICKFYKP
ncbi:MAG: acyl-ACP--UDP-N-acetylglucosamine O-acyltransferase [Deinococcota bacterium]